VKPGETWLDVGAHYGYTALSLARLVGPTGRVFAFEPVPSTARCLTETRLINNLGQLHVIAVGLSDAAAPTSVEMRISRGMAQGQLDSGGAQEIITVASLDRIWSTLAGDNERIHGVKLDVQGMELHALSGMRALLVSHQPLVAVEFHRGVDRQAVLELLASCGYADPGVPVAPLPVERQPLYVDDRTYVFSAGTRPD
jgi:FkbM family methyltransferase